MPTDPAHRVHSEDERVLQRFVKEGPFRSKPGPYRPKRALYKEFDWIEVTILRVPGGGDGHICVDGAGDGVGTGMGVEMGMGMGMEMGWDGMEMGWGWG